MNLLALKPTLDNRIASLLSKLFSPAIIASIATKIPLALNTRLVEKVLNETFLEQIQDADFDFLTGRQLQIEIIDAALFVGLSFTQGRISCTHFACESYSADATLSIDSFHAILLAEQNTDPDTLFFQRKLKIKGDTELAHHVKNTIDTLDPETIPDFLVKLIGIYKQQILQPWILHPAI